MKNILRYTAALFYVVLALTSCLPEEPVHESINMGAGEVTSLSSSAADLLCEIEDELPKYTKIEYGIVYSDNQEKVENHKGVKKIEGRDLSENRFLVQLTDLKAKQEYFYCSYLRLDEGRIIYGDISSFVTKASYKVTFNANGGKGGMEPQHFEEDDNKALTENTFTREGHEFAGWNTKADGSGQYFHPQQAHLLTDNVNLFAQWQVVSGMEEGYTYVDLGLSVEWATRNVGAERREAYGDYFAWGETQTKNNYAWETYQWGVSAGQITKYCIDAAHGKNGATDGKTTLELTDDAARVQWKGAWRMPTLAEQKELREKCTWKWKNLNGIAGYEVTGPSGKSIFLPAAGFKNNDAIYQQGSYGCYWSSSLYEIQSDYAYYLNIIPSTREQGQYSRSYGYSVRPVYLTYYCVRFDANQGEGKMDSLMVKKTESLTIPANQFTRDGYIFTAWNTAPDGSGTKVAVQSKFLPTSDTTFYAQWHKVWMLHFDANGGKYNGSGTTMPDQQFKDGEAQEIDANVFTREKHKFVCWNTKADGSGDSIADKQELLLTSDTTLYAQWHEWYTIKLYANGGSGTATIYNQLFEETVSNQLLGNPFTRSSYVFTGWNTKADGSGVSYDDKATITASSDMDLYAQWKAVYKLTFNNNGAMSNMLSQTFYAGEAQQINKNTITRSGYKFMDWNTKADGTGTSYRDGDSILLNANMTLYAQWQVVSGTAQGYDYVDLGLPSGTKWATCNVGATQPYEYGDYFAWGETVTKKSYEWNNYKHGTKDLLTKYCDDIDKGKDDFVDYLNMLLSVDDVASFKQGGNWRMPLQSEILELRAKCVWTWVDLAGVKGYQVKGSNGNTIFLPATGSYDGSELFEVGKEAYYWSGSLNSSANANAACALSFSATNHDYAFCARSYGHSVRPVLSTQYSLFFDANGGTGTMTVQKVPKGASLTLRSNTFTKIGYIFTGWNTRPDGEGRSFANMATLIPMENMQLYAQWHQLVYVFLNPNGGSGTQVKQTLKKDVETALTENSFTRKGYVFDSWNTKADGTGTSYADKASITLSKDLQLYAQWKKEGYTITFNANGGKGEMKSMQFVYSENQTLPQNTYTRESAIFVGWNTKADGTGVSYADGMSCTFEANTTLYAQWLVISGNQDGKDYVDMGLSVQWAVYNVGAERPEQYGDYFAWGETQPKEVYSWTNYAHGTATDALTKYTDSDGLTHLEKEDDAAVTNWGGDWRMPTQEEMAELLNKCSWHWTAMNGVTGYLVSAQNGNSLFLPAAGYRISQAMNDGGTYGRYWTSDKHQYASATYLVLKETSAIVSYVIRSEGHTIRPVLSDKALIEFNANGGSGSMTAFKPKKGELVALPKNAFTRANYVFAGWNTKADGSGTHYEDGASITPGVYVKLFAQWKRVCTITFSANGGGGPSMTPLQAVIGSTQELPANTYSKYSYYFTEWNTKADGSGKAYQNGDSILVDKEMTLYAQWSILYIISFDPNGASGEMSEQFVVPGEKVALVGNQFSRTQYIFEEWNTEIDASGDCYSDKDSIMPSGNMILYAQWKRYFIVHFLPNGGTGSMVDQVFYEGDEKQLIHNTFVREGYVFVGWNTGQSGNGTAYADRQSILSPTRNLYLYAQWRSYCSVAFDPNGGSGTQNTQQYVSGIEQVLNANTFTRDGWVFIGWNTSPDGSGTWYNDAQPISINASVTLYAQWMQADGEENGHAYVDLGLPSGTKWAAYNVGAHKPEEYGDYFAFGETEPKDEYSWNNYKFGAAIQDFVKYNSLIDDKTMLDAEDDAAHVNWGGNWRMPLLQDFKELLNNCTSVWTKVGEVNGYKLTSKINGNSIYLPAAGYKYDRNWVFKNSYAFYRAADKERDGHGNAIQGRDGGAISEISLWMREACSVRPILSSAYSITFDANGGSGTMEVQKIPVGQSQTIAANTFTKAGYEFAGWNTAADGSGTAYTNEQVVTLEWNLKLYAQWKIGKFTVTFDANGGSGNMPAQEYTGNMEQSLTANTFTKNNAIFVGWNTAADGSGTAYTDQQSIAIISNLTLYAQWMEVSGTENGHGYVDLGLSVKWSAYNLGANVPNGYGNYYAWGETEPKDDYQWRTYKFGDSHNDISNHKYNENDKLIILDPDDDAAHANWGSHWRMPTGEELNELKEKCSWKWISIGGVNGYEIEGPSGSKIFMPAAGYQYATSPSYQGGNGFYWSATRDAYQSKAYFIEFYSSGITYSSDNHYRYDGHCIRPILASAYSITFDVNGGSGTMEVQKIPVGQSQAIAANTFTKAGYKFAGWNTAADGSGTSYTNEQVVTLEWDLKLYAQWKVYVSGTENGHGYIDLGLPSGTKWAAYNVGATKPIEYGDFFAWGETKPKNDYQWSTYQFGNGSNNLTKYNGKDGKESFLDAEDDAATVNWGGNWRMPTNAEQEELLNNCTWTWTTQDGIRGYMLTSKHNDNTLFIPAGGYKYGTSVREQSSRGYYWMLSSVEGNTSNSGYFNFYSNSKSVTNEQKMYGGTIRPVLVANHTITFDANGGSGSMESLSAAKGLCAISKNLFTRDAYIFVGWNTASDGSGVSYKEQQRIIISENTTLYAQWQSVSGKENGHAYVDLGLPSGTKWAAYNVGTTMPDGYGDYFAWGETEPKEDYSWATYKFGSNSSNLTKYNSTDGRQMLASNDDVARIKWGGSWRIPNRTEIDELRSNCTMTWVERYGTKGFLFTSKHNGNSIYLPAAGFYEGRNLTHITVDGYYWLSSLSSNYINVEGYAFYQSNTNYNTRNERFFGRNIRPVFSSNYFLSFHANGGSGNMTNQSFDAGETRNIYANAFTKAGYDFVGWNTEMDGSGTAYANEAAISINYNTMLFAQWKVSSFTVNFDANGGSGSMSSQSFQGDTEQAIQANTFTRANALFVGWNTAADGSGTSYSDKQAALITDNITLYAQWQVVSGSEQGHDYVDLGLSVKWATYNLGADYPSEYGEYYAWGETAPKTRYDWDRYKWTAYDGATPWLTKYCNDASKGKNGHVDNFTMLELADDAAHANYGGNWRMPTTQEMQELRDKCTWMHTSMNGIQGYKITSNINGNSIFLPAAGYKYDTNLSDEGRNTYYWTNTFDTGNSLQAKELRNDRTNQNRDRKHGCSVRPVYTSAITITFDANGGTGSMSPINAVAGLCTIPENTFTREGYEFWGWCTTADASGTWYSENVDLILHNTVTLYAMWSNLSDLENGHGLVDLGLSVKWATCNIGANRPEEYGELYAWGETEPKSEYSWRTYKYCKGTENTLTKYCGSSEYGYNGFTDNKNTLDLSDDAARANWGGSWRMPTHEEQIELMANCIWTRTSQNGVNGYMVESKINGNSIFLPSVGVWGAKYLCYLRTNSISISEDPHVIHLCEILNESTHQIRSRCEGFPVRAVCP